MRRLVLFLTLVSLCFEPVASAKYPPSLWLEPSPTGVSLGRATEVTVSIYNSKKRKLQVYVCDGQGAGCIKGGDSAVGTLSVVAGHRNTAVVRYTGPASAPAESFCVPAATRCGMTLKVDLVNDKGRVIASSTAGLGLLGDAPGRGRSRIIKARDYPADVLVDEARGLIFMSVTGANVVEVLALPDAKAVRSIPVPRPRDIDRMPSGLLVVGGETQFLHLIDPDLLQVVDRIAFSPIESSLDPGPLSGPVGVAALADGTVLVSATVRGVQWGKVVRWNPATGTFTDFVPNKSTSTAPHLSRSADGRRAVTSFNGDIYLLDVATGVVAGPSAQKAHDPILSPDGERIVASYVGAVLVFDSSLAPVKTLLSGFASGYVYSPDNTRLYVWVARTDEVKVFDAASLDLVGSAQGVVATSVPSDIRPAAADGTGLIFGIAPSALTLSDVSSPVPALPPRGGLSFMGPSPEAGPPGVARPVWVRGSGLSPGPTLYFDDTPADPLTVEDDRILRTIAPALPQGIVDLTLVHPDGWFHISPEAYAYGPKVLWISHDAGPSSGGSWLQLSGYGLDFDPSQIHVLIDGNPVSNLSTARSESCWSCRAGYRTLQFKTPSGSPGPADITVRTPVGTVVVKGAFEYLESRIVPLAGSFAQILYDGSRDLVYLAQASEDRILSYDLATRSWRPPFDVGHFPVGVAMGAGGSKLLVANYGGRSVSILSLDGSEAPLEIEVVDPNLAFDPRPFRIASAGDLAFVAIVRAGYGCIGLLREIDLTTLQVRDRADGPLGCASNGVVMAPGHEGRFILFADTDSSLGPLALYDAASDSFTSLVNHGLFISDATLAGDGAGAAVDLFLLDRELRHSGKTVRAESTAILGSRLAGEKLHESGALLYVPYYVGVEISDAHTGARRARIAAPAPLLDSLEVLAVDGSGRRIMALTQQGLWIAELARAPLAIGQVTPESLPAATGGTIRIRGTGFEPGLAVVVDGVAVQTFWHDSTTLEASVPPAPGGRAQVSVVNPGGDRYDLDAALNLTD